MRRLFLRFSLSDDFDSWRYRIPTADLCPREALTSWLTFLRREHPTFLFRSATAFLPEALELRSGVSVQGKGKGKAPPRNDALGSEAILEQLASWAAEKEGDSLMVAVTGLTNVRIPLSFRSAENSSTIGDTFASRPLLFLFR